MKNIREERLYIQAFREIRSYIIKNGLKPGDMMPTEKAMCEMLGVSRNVLREAMKSMGLMGMICSVPGRGTEVLSFNLKFIFQNVMFATVGEDNIAIQEMLDIRKKIELGYMREAYMSMTCEDVKHIRSVFNAIMESWDQHVFSHADDRKFHMALFSHLENPTLASLLDAIWEVDENFMIEAKAKLVDPYIAMKHENIVTALEERNQDAFEAAMLTHFSSGKYSTKGLFSEPKE
ncbi:MAG: GntR family transcriptional regulator [Clostridia bacterium]